MAVPGDTSYRIAGELLVNGQSIPFYTIDVDINAYSMTSMIEATAPIYPLEGTYDPKKAIDWGPILQQNPLTSLVVRLGAAQITGGTSSTAPVPLYDIEQGYVDETNDDYAANEIHFTGRSTASVFQDNRLGNSPDHGFASNTPGSKFVSTLAQKRGFTHTQITASPGGIYIGAGYINNRQIRAFRGMSEWDEMQRAAFFDGYVLWVHNGLLYYGPPANNAPTLNLAWGQDLLNLEVNHAARRSHDVQLVGVGTIRKNGQRIYYSFPTGSNSQQNAGEVIPMKFGFIKDKSDLINRVQNAYKDIIRREFITTMTVVPTPDILRFVSQNGANFLIQVSGAKPSHNKIYHAKQVRFELRADGDEPSLTMIIIGELHPTVQGNYG